MNVDNHKLQDSIREGDKELVAMNRFSHPRDWYLIMVLIRLGPKPTDGPDTRKWVTWYFNTDSGGFNEGHYFDPKHDFDGDLEMCELKAREDFETRCERYCRPSRAANPYR